jgi:DNA-binding transcriptional ArsR family regulator
VYRFHLTPGDLAQVRFAVDPLWECVASVRVLAAPGRHALHRPWAAEAAEATRGLDLAPARALLPDGVCPPHLLAPPPEEPEPQIGAQLARLRGEAGLAPMADLLQAYWERALAPHWARFAAVLEGDILWRARLLALDGADGLLRDLHPQVCYADAVVQVRGDAPDRDVRPAGRGLLLVPSIFAWPDVSVATDPAVRPTLRYAARGVGELWLQECAPPSGDAAAALAELIGRTRARLLLRLAAPMTTGEVARRARLTAGAASQHLTALAGAGMLRRTRVGRRVYYERSPRAERVLAALREGGA